MIVTSLALMAVVTWQLALASINDLLTMSLAVASLIGLLRYRLNSAWLVSLGAAGGC